LEDCNRFISDTVFFIFTADFGYFWIFPRNPEKREVNIGFGLIGEVRSNLKNVLEGFKAEQKIEGKVNYVTGGLIPLGLQRPLMHDNILFVGDTGVGSFPLTGQGIYRALISGDVAGKCIANNYPGKYPYIINQKFLKWDIIGKTFMRINHMFRNIGPRAVTKANNWFIQLHGAIH
jgi:flavin-dependent dehydrogenase